MFWRNILTKKNPHTACNVIVQRDVYEMYERDWSNFKIIPREKFGHNGWVAGFRSESYIRIPGNVSSHTRIARRTSVDGKIQINDADTCCAHCRRIISFRFQIPWTTTTGREKKYGVRVVRRCYVDVIIHVVIVIILSYHAVGIRRVQYLSKKQDETYGRGRRHTRVW